MLSTSSYSTKNPVNKEYLSNKHVGNSASNGVGWNTNILATNPTFYVVSPTQSWFRLEGESNLFCTKEMMWKGGERK